MDRIFGGYTDMLAQRRPGPAGDTGTAARPASKPRPATEARADGEAKPGQADRPRRLTFKDRHALETLPARIAALQEDVARLTAALADPDLYARDPVRFASTSQALAAAQEAMAAAEDQWLTLEMLREEIEG